MLLGILDHTFVRDQESLDLAHEIAGPLSNCSLGADPAITLPVERTAAVKRRLGVIVRSWLEEGDWLTTLAEALDMLGDPELEVVFIPMQHTGRHLEDDVAASRAVADRMQTACTLTQPETPQDFVGELASCAAIVTMRLHGALVALAAGIPAVALSYDPKVSQQMRRSGQERFARSIHEVSADWLSDAITKALSAEPLHGVLGDAAETVRSDVRRLEDVQASSAPLPAEVLEHVIAGRAVEIASARRQLDAELEKAADLENQVRSLESQVEQLRTALTGAETARSNAVAMYDELAGSRAVRLASSAWKVRSKVDELLRRRAR